MVEAYQLTPGEREIVQLISLGLCTAQIAAQLQLSRHTVRDHLRPVYEKVSVSSRGELIARSLPSTTPNRSTGGCSTRGSLRCLTTVASRRRQDGLPRPIAANRHGGGLTTGWQGPRADRADGSIDRSVRSAPHQTYGMMRLVLAMYRT
jgi:DNA-binding CsgD family transcriptional regulator